MSDRWVFLIAFLTVIVIVAGAFAMPQYFYFELLKSLIFLAIALLVFFGEDRFSYMLGMVAPILGFVMSILLGGGFGEFKILFGALTGKASPPMSTPLHGSATLLEIVLIIVCYRAWHKQVAEKFFGKTFWICPAISIGYVAILAGLRFHPFEAPDGIPFS
jgi:energy-coupling factor transporter transmembrane protein EcfT